MEKSDGKPLIMSNLDEFAKVVMACFMQINQNATVEQSTKPYTERKLVYGIKGLMKLCGCSRAKAQRLKSSGKIDQAISQDGHTIIIDAELALELMKLK